MTGHGGLIRIQALGVGSAVLSPDAALVVAAGDGGGGGCSWSGFGVDLGLTHFSPFDFAPFLSRILMFVFLERKGVEGEGCCAVGFTSRFV